MSRAKDYDFDLGFLIGGFTIYPYQVALGVSLRYWPCLFAPSIRVHIGPFKIWVAVVLKRVS